MFSNPNFLVELRLFPISFCWDSDVLQSCYIIFHPMYSPFYVMSIVQYPLLILSKNPCQIAFGDGIFLAVNLPFLTIIATLLHISGLSNLILQNTHSFMVAHYHISGKLAGNSSVIVGYLWSAYPVSLRIYCTDRKKTLSCKQNPIAEGNSA